VALFNEDNLPKLLSNSVRNENKNTAMQEIVFPSHYAKYTKLKICMNEA